MFTVHNIWTGMLWKCSRNEAWFWAWLNESNYHSLLYNVYGPRSSQPLSAIEVAYYPTDHA